MEQPRTHTSTTSATAAAAATSTSPPPSANTATNNTANSSSVSPQSTTTPGCTKHSPSVSSSAGMTKVHTEGEEVDVDMDRMRVNSKRHSGPLLRPEDEDTLMEGMDENCAILPNERLSRKEYIEAGSSANMSGGTITPHNDSFMNTDNEGNLFKQFDSKTGQFLRTQPLVKCKFDNSYRQPPNLNPVTTPGANAPSLRFLTKGKFRSHSVPTISHSSLRRLTSCNNHAHYHYHQQQNHSMFNNAGVKKKKVMKATFNNNTTNCIISGEPITTSTASGKNPTSSRATRREKEERITENPRLSGIQRGADQNKNQSALRKAILLCQNQSVTTKYQNLSLQERINYVQSQTTPIPAPPINLQCLKEIDLQEIVKNPQLRHDIIFDPLLQFRPNLDGERGIKKRQLADKYWNDVENEIYVYSQRPNIFNFERTRLVPLFDTLRDVLLTIVPQREAHVINNILDTELNVQELLKGSLIMSSLSEWLARLFKHHCAPMRDAWVDKMSGKFKEAENETSLSKLVEGLRLVFQILEAMKLDIANHQIRVLRTALLSNSVEFEKQYFQSLMSSNRINLKSSLVWFDKKFDESDALGLLPRGKVSPQDVYKVCVRSITSLLSCRKMVREYPTSLSFDHARLILLRADIRQIVCLLICRLLFKQLVANDTSIDKSAKDYITSSYTTKRLKLEIVSIITDDHGNCRWTKNTMSIAVHLCKVINDLKSEYARTMTDETQGIAGLPSTPTLDSAKIDFAKSWLSRQTQPLSEVYGVLENRVFKSLEESIFKRSGCTMDGRVKQDFIHLCSSVTANTATQGAASTSHADGTMTSLQQGVRNPVSLQPQFLRKSGGDMPSFSETREPTTTVSTTDSNNNMFHGVEMEEFDSVYRHLYTVINFHWSVFGCHYLEFVAGKMDNRTVQDGSG